MKRRIAGLALIGFYLAVSMVLPAQGVSVNDLTAETSSVLQWNPFRHDGLLVKGGKVVSFKPDVPYLVFNYEKKESVPPVTLDGGVPRFPGEAAEKIRAYFAIPSGEFDQNTVKTIIIDPGHGGRDTGAVATHTLGGKKVTLQEKDIVLDVSLEIARRLEQKYPGKTVLLTRKTDVYPSLEERVELANGIQLGAYESIIYISIHANASPFNKAARGYEAWYLPPDYRRDLVDPQTVSADGKDILPILNTMREEEYTVESILLARSITGGIEGSIGNLSPNRGLKEQSWFVVRNAKMPSVLVELGFITNEPEAALFNDQAYLKKLSDGIYTGITNFITGFENPEKKRSD